MLDYWIWWGAAVLLGVLELLTGTFYLLMLAIGVAAGGIAAVSGSGVTGQFLVAAVVAVVGWLALRHFVPRPARTAAAGNRDLHLDIGSTVRIERWKPDGRAEVSYRGANWAAELASGEPTAPQPGEYVIRRIEGNRLIVGRPSSAAQAQ